MTASGLGMTIDGLWFLSPREVQAVLGQDPLLVDLRMDELVEMKTFDVPRWIHIPHDRLAEGMADLPKDRLLILADSSGVYTKAVARELLAHGYERIACLIGGMLIWDQEGFPVRTDPDLLLNGQCPCVLKSGKGRAAKD
jgi:rhodanese-related sulfurtransferase